MLLTEHEAALAVKVSDRTIRRLIEAGKLRAANYGQGRKKYYRIDPADLLTVQQSSSPPAPEPRRRRVQQQGMIVKREILDWLKS